MLRFCLNSLETHFTSLHVIPSRRKTALLSHVIFFLWQKNESVFTFFCFCWLVREKEKEVNRAKKEKEGQGESIVWLWLIRRLKYTETELCFYSWIRGKIQILFCPEPRYFTINLPFSPPSDSSGLLVHCSDCPLSDFYRWSREKHTRKFVSLEGFSKKISVDPFWIILCLKPFKCSPWNFSLYFMCIH